MNLRPFLDFGLQIKTIKWTQRGLFICLMAGLVACQTRSRSENTYRSGEQDRPLVDDKYTLQPDRDSFKELRAQVPAEKKQENDELAVILGYMAEGRKSPSEVRSQFDTAIRKKRQLFDKDLSKERESFTKEERKKRDEFLKSQQAERTAFSRQKSDRETSTNFYRDLDQKRSEFMSVERDRRADFESDASERRKNFEAYLREKQNEFTQEWRSYSRRYEEQKNALPLKKSQPDLSHQGVASGGNEGKSEALQLENELNEAKRQVGTPLEAGQ